MYTVEIQNYTVLKKGIFNIHIFKIHFIYLLMISTHI